MGFKDEIVKITQDKLLIEETVNKIKDEIKKTAKTGSSKCCKVYKLETENKIHLTMGYGDVQVDYSAIRPVSKKDAIIIKEFMDMGFDVTFNSVNLNPYPEVGQEGYSAAFFMNVEW